MHRRLGHIAFVLLSALALGAILLPAAHAMDHYFDARAASGTQHAEKGSLEFAEVPEVPALSHGCELCNAITTFISPERDDASAAVREGSDASIKSEAFFSGDFHASGSRDPPAIR